MDAAAFTNWRCWVHSAPRAIRAKPLSPSVARVAAYCVAFVSQARAATMLELDVVTEIFDAGQGVRRLQLARLSHDNHEEDKAREERTVKAGSKRKTVERQRGSAKAPLVNEDISRQADKTDDAYEDNDLGTEWRSIDRNEPMKNRPKC